MLPRSCSLDALAASDDDVAYVRSISRLLDALFPVIYFAVISGMWKRLARTSGDKIVVTFGMDQKCYANARHQDIDRT